MKDSKSKIISGILVLIIIFLIAVLVYFVLENNKLEKEITNNTTTTETSLKSNDINNTTSAITTTTKDNSSSGQENSVSIKQALVINVASLLTNVDSKPAKTYESESHNDYYKISAKYSCTLYDDYNDKHGCLNSSVLIDDKFEFTVDMITSITRLIKTDKYYILEYVAGGVMQYQFEIYDMNGKKVYSEKDCTILFGNSYVEDGIYNYNSFTEIDDQHDRLYHRTIDLNKDVLKSESDIDYIIDKLPQSS